MRPLKITVNSFLPFVGQHTLLLESIHAAAVCGPNGSGKSSLIVDSILFAVKGKARKRPEELIYDLADSMWVELLSGSINKSSLLNEP